MALRRPHIIVVGAGITGACLTYHLVKQNAQVTLIDKALKPACEATGKSFAWIVAGHDDSEVYIHLRQQAIKDWHRVEDELNGQLKINWTGALTWLESDEKTEEWMHKLNRSDARVRLVNEQELRCLEPNLKVVPSIAMFVQDEGAIDPTLTVNAFVRAAQEQGAKVLLSTKVLSLLTHQSVIEGVITEKGSIKADAVVLATGIDTPLLCEPLDLKLPVAASPSVLMTFHNKYRFVNHIVSNPFVEIRAASNKLTVAAEDYIDESLENRPESIALRTLNRIKEHWDGVDQIRLENVRVGKRPMPKDGLPIIGRVENTDGLYLFVMHTGVTLAAITGRLAAAEILNHREETLLSSYRLQRFE